MSRRPARPGGLPRPTSRTDAAREPDSEHQPGSPGGAADHGEEDQGRVVELVGDEPVVGGDVGGSPESSLAMSL